MDERKREEEQQVGHDSTTIPGGEKEMSGDPGRTPGKAEGDEQTAEESPRQK
jgi:hypothetical protein